jgi:hypothetical protein
MLSCHQLDAIVTKKHLKSCLSHPHGQVCSLNKHRQVDPGWYSSSTKAAAAAAVFHTSRRLHVDEAHHAQLEQDGQITNICGILT